MKHFKSFFMVWTGQVVSIFGSGLSWFALGIWLYQQTGSVSKFALVALCAALPQMLLSPFAGVLIDRFSRRWMMILADAGAAACTLGFAGLFLTGQMQVWQLYLLTALSAGFNAFQNPAYKAYVASAIERSQLGRANGMLQFGQGLAEVLAPALAGVLVLMIGIPGVLLIDLATFGVAVLSLMLVRIPPEVEYPRADSGLETQKTPWFEALQTGWEGLRAQRGLVNLLRYQVLFSFLWNLFAVMVVPMILGFAAPGELGLTLTLAGSGLLAGSLILSAWGGPRRRLTGLLVFELVSGVAFCLMGSRPLVWLVASGAFLAHLTLAFVSGLGEAVWQAQVPQALQGRIFSLKQAVVKAATLAAYLAAGGLADQVFDPLLHSGGILAVSLGNWFGTGSGRGIALVFFLIGLLKMVSVVAVYLSPGTHQLDEQLQEQVHFQSVH
ncbi:MAG: MFS transporter [Anaerolineales bacterium]|nr:MFS transporter [Anaerolineales bacterium]